MSFENLGASERRFEVRSIRVASILCLNSGPSMTRASSALSVETVDGDKRGLKTGRGRSSILFLELKVCGTPSIPRKVCRKLGIEFASLGEAAASTRC